MNYFLCNWQCSWLWRPCEAQKIIAHSSVPPITSSTNHSYVIGRTQERKARYAIEDSTLEFWRSWVECLDFHELEHWGVNSKDGLKNKKLIKDTWIGTSVNVLILNYTLQCYTFLFSKWTCVSWVESKLQGRQYVSQVILPIKASPVFSVQSSLSQPHPIAYWGKESDSCAFSPHLYLL